MSKKPMWYEKYGVQSLPNCELINRYGFYIPNLRQRNHGLWYYTLALYLFIYPSDY